MFSKFCQSILKKINIIDDETNGFSKIHFNLMYIYIYYTTWKSALKYRYFFPCWLNVIFKTTYHRVTRVV